jgi:hypothetical protein
VLFPPLSSFFKEVLRAGLQAPPVKIPPTLRWHWMLLRHYLTTAPTIFSWEPAIPISLISAASCENVGDTMHIVREEKTPVALRNASDQFFEWQKPVPAAAAQAAGESAAKTHAVVTETAKPELGGRAVAKSSPPFIVETVKMLPAVVIGQKVLDGIEVKRCLVRASLSCSCRYFPLGAAILLPVSGAAWASPYGAGTEYVLLIYAGAIAAAYTALAGVAVWLGIARTQGGRATRRAIVRNLFVLHLLYAFAGLVWWMQQERIKQRNNAIELAVIELEKARPGEMATKLSRFDHQNDMLRSNIVLKLVKSVPVSRSPWTDTDIKALVDYEVSLKRNWAAAELHGMIAGLSFAREPGTIPSSCFNYRDAEGNDFGPTCLARLCTTVQVACITGAELCPSAPSPIELADNALCTCVRAKIASSWNPSLKTPDKCRH